MNEKQVKRVRRAMRRYVKENERSLDAGPPVRRRAELLASVYVGAWPQLDHRRRGRVSRALLARGL